MNKPNAFRSLISASGQSPVETSTSPVPSVGLTPTGRHKVAKRTAPGYVQIGAYVPKMLHNAAKVKLIQENGDRDFSQLLADLLAAYVNG